MMSKILHKASLLRYFLVVVLLLGVFVLNAEKSFAIGADAGSTIETKSGGPVATSKAIFKKKTSPESYSPFAALKQNFSIEATILPVNFTLQQVVIAVLSKSYAFPTDEVIPLYSLKPPGISFIAQIVPISILPNAP